MTTTALFRDSLLDAAAVLFPVRCSGCGEPDRGLCTDCRRELTPCISTAVVDSIPVWWALEYSGTARRVLLAFKESGRVDAAAALGRALRVAVVEAQRSSGPTVRARDGALLPVLIPSTTGARRRRGFHPSAMMLARAGVLVPPLWGALRLTRQTRDQAGLSLQGRAANRDGSLAASKRFRGRQCLIVDDIVTSGATITEAARAIRAAGGAVVGAAAVARTPRRDDAGLSADPRHRSSE